MNGKEIIKLLADAGVIHPDVTGVQLNAQSYGHLSIHTQYGEMTTASTLPIPKDELDRLRQIAQLAAKMVKLQLEDGQVDDVLAEQIKALING